MNSDFLSQLDWRFAAKDFVEDKKVSAENLEKIVEAVHLTPSSYGLQPYHVYVVQAEEIKQKIQEIGFNQPQYGHSTAILVFCSRTDVLQRIDEYQETVSGGNPEVKEKLQGYTDIMRGTFKEKTVDERKAWADRQTYLALGFAMAACAELEVDSCPMEGFIPAKMDELLELPTHMKSVACLTLGYRTADPKRGKFRFSKEDLFTEIN
jgi:nitroreductase/dihydropteridine reductase